MATGQTPPQFGSVEKSVRDEGPHRERKCAGRCWTTALATGSLATGAALVARGNRRQGLAVTAAGVMVLLLENPDDVGAVWGGIPKFIETVRRLLDRTEGIVEDLTNQAETVRDFLDKAAAPRA